MPKTFNKDLQYYKFCFYGFLKNLQFFEPFLLLFFLEKGINFLQIGILYSVREIIRNIFEIPSGIAADFFGRRRTMIASFAIYIASFTILYLSTNYGLLILGIGIFAIADAFRTGTHKAMIFEYLKLKGWEDQKVHYYGHTRSFSQLGSAFSAIIAAVLVFYTKNYSSIFLYSTIPYILDLLLMISYPKELDGTNNYKDLNLSSAFKSTIKDFITSFKNVRILKAMASISLFSSYYKVVKDYLQPIVKTLALSTPFLISYEPNQRSAMVIGIVYFTIFLLTTFSARSSGRLSEKFSSLGRALNISLIIGFIIGIISSLFYIGNFTLFAIIIFIGIFMIENIRKPIGIAYITEEMNSNVLASVLSAQSQADTLIAALLAPLFGFFADLISLPYAMIIISTLLLLMAPLIRLTKKG